MNLLIKQQFECDGVDEIIDKHKDALEELYKNEMIEYEEDCKNKGDEPDWDDWWIYFIYDYGVSSILYDMYKEWIEKNNIPFADVEVRDGDIYQVDIITVYNVTRQDIEELVSIYQKERKLPEIPEPVVEKLLKEDTQ